MQALLQDMGCEFREYAWPDRWYFRGERRLKPSSEEASCDFSVTSTMLSRCCFQGHGVFLQDADVNAVMDKFESVGKQDFPAQDLSAEQWLRNGGASERMIDIADACFANDFGCSIPQLGMRETILENRKWDSGDTLFRKLPLSWTVPLNTNVERSYLSAGETYLVLDRSLSKVVQHIGNSLSAQTLLNWPLHRVELSPGSVALTSLRGERLRCRHLVLTLPLAILQRGDVLFRPPLPEHKLGALSRIKMSNAVKVVAAHNISRTACTLEAARLEGDGYKSSGSASGVCVLQVIVALERPIWPEGFFDVVCPGCFIPEFWVTEYPREAEYRGPNLYGITGFACGKKAEQLSGMRESALVIATLAQLDELFGEGVMR